MQCDGVSFQMAAKITMDILGIEKRHVIISENWQVFSDINRNKEPMLRCIFMCSYHHSKVMDFQPWNIDR